MPALNNLQQLRKDLYLCFHKRKDATMNLLDALTSDGNKYKSVVQLSDSVFFERQYSSITDAIADGLTDVNWDEIRKLIFQHTHINNEKSPYKFIIDCTPNPRPYSRKLSDKHITHLPNPAPGNRPICVGHQYSIMALLPSEATAQKKHWLIPVVAKRVQSSQKGNEVGMEELVNYINELKLTDRLCISIADSLYGTGKCRETASKQDNLVHIVRLNSTRNVFAKPSSEDHSSKGRKKEFGTKMNLNNVATYLTHDQSIQTKKISKKGKELTISIKAWNDMLLRGSKDFKSSEYPLNLIQITVTNQEGNNVFKKPLWIAVLGKRKHELELIDVYNNYASRYDIEHFFRFGKQNLLMDAYQTPDIEHEELWWKLCMLAYVQLYMAKEMVKCIPRTWERYLPEYKHSTEQQQTLLTPSQTQRGFANLLTAIGTPAQACITRGKSPGRIAGEKQPIKNDQPIIFKTKKMAEQTKKNILSGV